MIYHVVLTRMLKSAYRRTLVVTLKSHLLRKSAKADSKYQKFTTSIVLIKFLISACCHSNIIGLNCNH